MLVGGQGITSGFRDAISLAWRLSIACSSKGLLNYERLFEGWYLERKQQLDKSLASTVRNGDLVNGKSLTQIFIRNWAPGSSNSFLAGDTGSNEALVAMDQRSTSTHQGCHSCPSSAVATFPLDILHLSKKKCRGAIHRRRNLRRQKDTRPFQLVLLLDHENERHTAAQDLQRIMATLSGQR